MTKQTTLQGDEDLDSCSILARWPSGCITNARAARMRLIHDAIIVAMPIGAALACELRSRVAGGREYIETISRGARSSGRGKMTFPLLEASQLSTISRTLSLVTRGVQGVVTHEELMT